MIHGALHAKRPPQEKVRRDVNDEIISLERSVRRLTSPSAMTIRGSFPFSGKRFGSSRARL
jgi:hypothetical protein